MTSSPRWVWHFADALPPDSEARQLLGGKGAGLWRLVRAGFDVPPGFVISTAACRDYLRHGQRLPESLWQEVAAGVARLERETGCRYGELPEPLLLAVRSGAPTSMPGILDTLLCCGLTERLAVGSGQQAAYARFIQALAASHRGLELGGASARPGGDAGEAEDGDDDRYLQRLAQFEAEAGEPFPQDCWELLRRAICAVMDSWQRPRAVRYRAARGLSDSEGTAVIVQAMFGCEVSGVLFTRDPRGGAGQRMVVEAVRGLGEKLVSGRATPQRYYISRSDLAVQAADEFVASPGAAGSSAEVGGRGEPMLSLEQLRMVGQIGMRLEQQFGSPLDVEWGAAAGRLVLFQVRTAESAGSGPGFESALADEIRRLQEVAAGRTTIWVRHNLGEGLPAPTPLTWDVVRRLMSVDGGYGRLYRELGYRPSQSVREHGFLELVCGRIYVDVQRLPQLFMADLPLRYDFDALRRDPGLIDRAPRYFDPGLASSWFLFKLPWILWVLHRAGRRVRRATRDAERRFDQDVLPEFVDYVRGERARQLDGLLQGPLVDLLHQRIDRVLGRFASEALRPGLLGSLAFAAAEEQLVRLLGADEGRRWARQLIAGLEAPGHGGQPVWSAGGLGDESSVETFLQQFGHRAAGEWELAVPRWREDRGAVERWMQTGAGTGAERVEQRRRDAESKRSTALEQLRVRLAEQGARSLLPAVERDLCSAWRLLPYREIGKHYLMMGYELIRQVVEQLAVCTGLGERIYYLRLEELDERVTDSAEIRGRADRRRRRWHQLKQVSLGDVIEPSRLESLGREAARPPTGRRLAGTPLSGGTARGPVLIVSDPRQAAVPQSTGYVLVCAAIDPGYTPLLLNASGLLVEFGGLLSHGAVVARQFGIPAVACRGILAALESGERSQMVVVDGDAGQVILE